MTAPASNFRLSAPGSGWLLFQENDVSKIASMNGITFVKLLQNAIAYAPELETAKRTFDGTSVRGSSVLTNGATDGNWGPATFKALWALMNERGMSADLKTAVEGDARAGAIGLGSMMAAGSIILQNFGRVPSVVVFPRGASFPMYRVRPPGVASLSFAVTDADADRLQAVGITPVVRPAPDAGTASTEPTADPTTTGDGKDVMGGDGTTSDKTGGAGTGGAGTGGAGTGGGGTQVTGTPPPGTPSTLPAGARTTRTIGSGISWGPVFVTVGLVAVIGIIGYTMMGQPAASPAPARTTRTRSSRRGR